MSAALRSFLRDCAANLGSGLRLALFRRVDPGDLRAAPGQLIGLAALQMLLDVAVSFVTNGPEGYFDPGGVPASLMFPTLLLLGGYLTSRLTRDPAATLALPVALLAPAPAFAAVYGALAWLEGRGLVDASAWTGAVIAYLYQGWVVAVYFNGLHAVAARVWRKTLAAAGVLLLVAALPQWYIPQDDLWANDEQSEDQDQSLPAVTAEEVLFHQRELLGRELAALAPQRRGVTDLYFVGFAGYAFQDVFMKEILAVRQLFDARFDTRGRSLVLINNRKTLGVAPLATATNLATTLKGIGRIMDPKEDILFLFISSHGSASPELTVDFPPLELDQLDPALLKRDLDAAGIRWRVIVLSACYSGGFIDALKNESTLIITAASAHRTSFGCSNGADFTYFGRAFFNQQLRRTHSFSRAFYGAEQTIARWEEERGYAPSRPQIYLGEKIRAKLADFEQRLRRRRERRGALAAAG